MIRAILVVVLLAVGSVQARTQESIQVGGKQAFLHKPANARASAILVPGKGGNRSVGPALAKSRCIERSGDRHAHRPARHRSRRSGAIHAQGKGAGRTGRDERGRKLRRARRRQRSEAGLARAHFRITDGAWQTAGPGCVKELPSVMPRTLVLHNRNDACDLTPVAAVEPFVKWSGGRASVVWIGGSGGGKDPCGPNSAHGLMGADGQVVGAIVGFVAR